MHYQSLEPRRLFAASISQGLLTVTGTESADYITVSIGDGAVDVNINGTVQSIPAVKKVRVLALGGDDSVEISTSITRHASIDLGAGNDAALGGGGSDTIVGGTGTDLIYGNVGDDVLSGGDDDDTLRGDAGTDAVLGEDGDDLLLGDNAVNRTNLSPAARADYLDGGTGSDTIDLSLATTGGANVTIATVVSESTTTFTDVTAVAVDYTNSPDGIDLRGANFESFFGVAQANRFKLDFNGGPTDLTPVEKPLSVQGGRGNDTFEFIGSERRAALEVTLAGNAGNDDFSFDDDNDIQPDAILGGAGNDSVSISGVVGLAAMNLIDLGTGIDSVSASEFVPTTYTMPAWMENLSISNGNPGGTITGNGADNRISVGGPQFNVVSGTGDDVIEGGNNVNTGDGDDEVYGASGTINLGDGNDYYRTGGDPFVAVNGQAGDDLIDARTASASGAVVSLNGGDGNDTIYGTVGNDAINTGIGRNVVDAGAGDDNITSNGDSLRDVINGGEGDDTLLGDAGDVALSVETRS